MWSNDRFSIITMTMRSTCSICGPSQSVQRLSSAQRSGLAAADGLLDAPRPAARRAGLAVELAAAVAARADVLGRRAAALRRLVSRPFSSVWGVVHANLATRSGAKLAPNRPIGG